MSIDKTIRTLSISAFVLAALLALGIALGIASRQTTPTVSVIPERPQVDVALIELSKAGASVTLAKGKDGSWIAKGEMSLATNPQKVKDLLTTVYALNAERKVANGKDQYADLGIGDTDAVRLVLKDSKNAAIADYHLGGKASDASTYLRLGDDGPVWQVKGTITPLLKTSVAEWGDRRFWPTSDVETVKSFSVDHVGVPPTHFQKDVAAKSWKGSGSPEATKATSDEILSLLRQFIALDADTLQAYDPQAYTDAFKDKEKVFALTVTTDSSFGVELWRKKGDANGDYLVKPLFDRRTLEGKQILLTVPSYRIGDLKVQLAPPPAPTAAKK